MIDDILISNRVRSYSDILTLQWELVEADASLSAYKEIPSERIRTEPPEGIVASAQS